MRIEITRSLNWYSVGSETIMNENNLFENRNFGEPINGWIDLLPEISENLPTPIPESDWYTEEEWTEDITPSIQTNGRQLRPRQPNNQSTNQHLALLKEAIRYWYSQPHQPIPEINDQVPIESQIRQQYSQYQSYRSASSTGMLVVHYCIGKILNQY